MEALIIIGALAVIVYLATRKSDSKRSGGGGGGSGSAETETQQHQK